MQLHDLKPRPGARHRTKRLGCGESSGHGKTSGRGHKGQKARSGGSVRHGFEGGQMRLTRRLPKRGFNNKRHSTRYAPVNVSKLNLFEDGTRVDETLMREKRLVVGKFHGVKLLGTGEITKKLEVVVSAVSASAREKIEKAGGKVQLKASPDTPESSK